MQPRPNQPPRTYLWLFPDSTIAQGVSKQRIRWWGDDPDGIVFGYLFAVDSANSRTPGIRKPDTLNWTWTFKNDTLISFPLRESTGVFTVYVRAVDNTLGKTFTEFDHLRFTRAGADSAVPFWDRNNNGLFDSLDESLPQLVGAADPRGANQRMPLRNSKPQVRFADDPVDPSRPGGLEQPETTFTAATFAWVGTDFDGDETISEYRIALNDTSDSTRLVTLPQNVRLITLFVPRMRSDLASGEVDADVYNGNFGTFSSRPPIRTLHGLKLDSLNTFYVQARDVAGEYSPFIQMPQPGGRWFVRKPRSKLLVISDYLQSGLGDTNVVRSLYRNFFAQVILPSGSLGDYDELNIGRGISPTDKQNASKGIGNPQFGTLVPRFLDPAFVSTLFLFDYVFWYTDLFPSLSAAQSSLFYYRTSAFDGRRGKVLFSTVFQENPDPRGVLRDFAPIDSVTSIALGTASLTPAFGSLQIPGGYQVLPDSSDLMNIYPTLAFNTGQIHIAYMRPIYKKPDGRYIYRMQEDARTPIQYTFLVTTSELRSVSFLPSGPAFAVGSNGTIVYSPDGGISWSRQTSGTGSTLRSVNFVDPSTARAVGDSGTILTTDNGGSIWANRSILTVQNLMSVHFLDQQNGLVVGTKGLIIKTSDGGFSWSSLTSGTILALRSVQLLDASTAIAVGDSLTIWKTTDAGVTWRNRRPTVIPGAQLGRSLLSVQFPNAMTGFAVGEGGEYLKSTDGGETWVLQTFFTTNELRSIYFDDPTNGWAVGWAFTPFPGAGLIFRSVNGGGTWTQSFVGGTKQFLNSVSFQPGGNGIVVGSGGIILKAQNGGTATSDWSFQPKGPINVGVIDGDRRFVFIGLPLHLLNGQNTVKDFLQYVFLYGFVP